MKNIAQHLYIHWPFCHTKCRYCDFVAFERHDAYHDAYHRILCKEIEAYAQQYEKSNKQPITTIFLGGGTPSLYPLHLFNELFTTLKNNYNCSSLQEVTIESNPTDITEERMEQWREHGISRLSLGIQCLNDDVLLKLNRRQRTRDVFNAITIAPKYFDNISVDLILGLPGVTTSAWFDTLEQTLSWPIKHISIYFLTIHEKTPLFFDLQQGLTTLEDDQFIVDLYNQTVNSLEKRGFYQYEISNFAKKGYTSQHNLAYWNRKPYKGFGISAASFDGKERTTNTNNLGQYLASSNGSIFYVSNTHEILTQEQEFLELLMLDLRQKTGFDLQRMVYFESTHNINQFNETVLQLVSAGLLEIQNNTICLTVKGMVLENEIITQLLSCSQKTK